MECDKMIFFFLINLDFFASDAQDLFFPFLFRGSPLKEGSDWQKSLRLDWTQLLPTNPKLKTRPLVKTSSSLSHF